MVIADFGEETQVPIGGGGGIDSGGGGGGGMRRSGSRGVLSRGSMSRRKSAPSLVGMGLPSRGSSNALSSEGTQRAGRLAGESYDVPIADGADVKRGGLRKRVSSLTSLSSFNDLVSLVKSPKGGSGGGGLDGSGSFKVYNVMDLVDRQKWKRLRKFLETEEGREQVRASCRGAGDTDNGASGGGDVAAAPSPYEHFDGTALHHAVLRGADLDTIRALAVAGGPSLISGVDSGGRTALHAAAASPSVALSEDVVIYLIGLSGSKSAISKGDGDRRAPLHLACMERPPPSPGAGVGLFGSGEGGGSKGYNKGRKLSTAVIRALADACPTALLEEDNVGLTPLDYAFTLVIDVDGDISGKSSSKSFYDSAINPMLAHIKSIWSKREAAEGEDAIRARRDWTMKRSRQVRSAVSPLFERRHSGSGGRRGSGSARRGSGALPASISLNAAGSPGMR